MAEIPLRLDIHTRTPISPLLYGSFVEHIPGCIDGGLCNAQGIDPAVQQAVKELAPTALRFPGGTVMGIYHWQDFIGPVESRKKTANIVWGGRLDPRFGTDEFLQYCKTIGAEPMLTVNMPTGTPEEAAHWVEYCNGTGDTHYANLRRQNGHPQPYNVRWWFIGNESYAVPDLGLQDDPHIYTRQALEYAKYMKMTDPTLHLVAVGSETDDAWNETVLEKLGFAFEALSIHKYCQSENADPFAQLHAFEAQMKHWEAQLAKASAKPTDHDASGNATQWYRFPPRQGPIRLALDEWNIWNADGACAANGYRLYPDYTWRDALWTGCFLNLLHRHAGSVVLANQAQLVNVIAPIRAENGWVWKQPTFWPMQLWAGEKAHCALPCTASDPALDLSAVETEQNITVFAVNTGAAPLTLALPADPFYAVRLQSDLASTAPPQISTPGREAPCLPPYSITILKFTPDSFEGKEK